MMYTPIDNSERFSKIQSIFGQLNESIAGADRMPDSHLTLDAVSMEFAFLSETIWVSSRCSSFLPDLKDMWFSRLIDYSNIAPMLLSSGVGRVERKLRSQNGPNVRKWLTISLGLVGQRAHCCEKYAS